MFSVLGEQRWLTRRGTRASRAAHPL